MAQLHEELTRNIQTVLTDESALRNEITSARELKIQGKEAQQQVADLLDNHDALHFLCRYEFRQHHQDSSGSIEQVTETLVSDDYLSEGEAEEFLTFWDDINWIVPAVGVTLNNLDRYQDHWSAVELTPVRDNPEMFNYTMRWGVDKQLDAKLPTARILSKCLIEIDQIHSYLSAWHERDDVNDDYVAYLIDEYDIDWVTDVLTEIVEDLDHIQREYNTGTRSTSDPKIEISWSSDSSQDEVVGVMSIIPPEESIEESPDEDNRPPRGFQ